MKKITKGRCIMSQCNDSEISNISKEAVNLLLASIELEALGLSHVINAKKEVIQSALKTLSNVKIHENVP
jgi:metal-dependent hydrolase (beta-lactamase superfamily II)